MYTCANLTASCEEHPKWKNTAFQSFLWQGQVLFFFLLANFKPTSSHFLLKAASEGHTKTEYSSENYCHQIWWTKFNNNNMVKCFGFPFFWFSKSFLVPHYFDMATFTCCNVGSLLGVTNGSKCGLYLKKWKSKHVYHGSCKYQHEICANKTENKKVIPSQVFFYF